MMRRLLVCLVYALLMLLRIELHAHAQLLVHPAASPPGEESMPCVPEQKPCVFADTHGENIYTVDREQLTRTMGGQQVYAVMVGGKSLKVLFAIANRLRTQIAIVTGQVTLPTGGRIQREVGPIMPDQAHRQYWLSLRNPKTGEEIKSVDLGAFKPISVAMTATGDYIWIAGDELQLRRREVRAINARSGKMEHSAVADKGASVRLFERGFQLATTFYVGELDTGGAIRKHNSPNGFSIAEFTVRRPAGLSPKALGDAAVGVVAFQGGSPELREMLESALAIKIGSAGFKVVERQRLKELLSEAKFQNVGLTDASKAVELGRLANAQYLLFGQIQTTGTVSSLALRLVDVQDGTLKNGIELECRDCSPDDYLQGLTFMLQDWVDAAH